MAEPSLPKTTSINNPEIAKALHQWWDDLEKNRGDRAALRRCSNLTEIFFIPAYHRLYHDLAKHGWSDKVGVAAVAGLAAHVKNDAGKQSFATQMAESKQGGSNARVSGLRFRRLLKIQNRENLYIALTRIVRLLGGTVNLNSLADSAYWWNEQTRKQWAFDYYAESPQED